MAALVNKIPSQLSIARDPFWVNVPREVGDGMETLPEQSISSASLQTSVGKNEIYAPSSIASAAGSRCSSPRATYINIEFY